MDFENIFYDLVDLQLGEILENEPLYKHTTFKVGGPARLFVYIQDVEALKRGIQYCRQHQIFQCFDVCRCLPAGCGTD